MNSRASWAGPTTTRPRSKSCSSSSRPAAGSPTRASPAAPRASGRGATASATFSKTWSPKGIAGDTAQDAVSALEQDDYATALALWRQRFGKPPADQKEKARQVRFLQSRGFALNVVFRVLREQGVAADDE
ncbi:MAG: RecX family transcriptional regulator [Betaproteobacteria bacterium]|nr:RecX family transcriptional regulator [Betaproteobacteria bacterium]